VASESRLAEPVEAPEPPSTEPVEAPEPPSTEPVGAPEPTPAEPVEAPTQAPPPAPAPPAPAPTGALSLVDVRRLWPDVIAATQRKRRVTWIHLTQNSQVVGFDGTTLTLGFNNAGARGSFEGGSADVLQEAIREVVGAEWRVETILDPGAEPGAGAPPASPEPTIPAAPTAPAAPAAQAAAAAPAAPQQSAPLPPEPEPPAPRRPRMADIQAEAEAAHDPDAAVDRDDADVDAEAGADLLARELGAQVIEEIPHP